MECIRLEVFKKRLWKKKKEEAVHFAFSEASSAGTCHLEFPQRAVWQLEKEIKHFNGIYGVTDSKRVPCHV